MSTNPNTETSAITSEPGGPSSASAKDTASPNNAPCLARPQTPGSSAYDRLTSATSERSGTSGFTQEERETDVDGETEGVFEKEYEEGDCGKIEALHDLQGVFNELEGENLIQGFDVFNSYNLHPQKPPKIRGRSSSKKARVNSARAAAEQLTPAPRIGLALKNKKPMDLTKAFSSLNQSSIHSLPELDKKGPQPESLMRYEPTASLPLLGNKVDPLKRIPQGKKSKFVNPMELPPKHKHSLRSARMTTQTSTTASSNLRVRQMTPEETELAEAHQKIREDLDFLDAKWSDTTDEGGPDDTGILFRRLSSAESSFSDISTSSRGVTGIRTPTLPQQRETPLLKEMESETWKSDLVKVTRVKSIQKPPLHMPGPEGSTLQLKYKPPIWPHQKSLIQILDRMPLLTCLILDGSEIMFLRDLGSHLPSLQTLSVAKCGLRSLDGAFAFPNLRTLIASGNNITLPVQASYLQHLCHLDLSYNPIHKLVPFSQLVMCGTLVSLKLIGCPVSQRRDFYYQMKKMLPHVKEVRPEYYTPASVLQMEEFDTPKKDKVMELDRSQMMQLHDYIEKEIQKSKEKVHEDVCLTNSEGNEEVEETTEDVGDYSVVSDGQDMYLRRFEHLDDIEEGDGDHV